MVTSTITVSINQVINVGGYESIRPAVSVTATLEEGDQVKLDECFSQLHKEASRVWSKQALQELAWVAQRRSDPSEFRHITQSTREQLKQLL